MLSVLASLLLAQNAMPEDASAPLRRFPVSLMVRRAGMPDPVSLLRVPAISSGDELELRLGNDLSRDFTFAIATLSPSKPARVQSWNLWDRKYKTAPIKVGKLPATDMVVFFLVRNPRHDGRAANAIRQTLDSSSEKLLSATADYVSTFQQQDKLLNFMSAYSTLAAPAGSDPEILRDRITRLGDDLGVPVDPSLRTTSPEELRRSLATGLGVLDQLRKTPDDPAAQAKIAQSQLPGMVANWLGLVSDLMHVFVKPRRELKITFVPASAVESANGKPDFTDLVTQRVLETQDSSLPAVVYRPTFERTPKSRPIPLAFERAEVLSNGKDVAIPLAAPSRDLFTRPQAWDWELRVGDGPVKNLPDAKLVPGRGLVFGVDDAFWGANGERDITLTARVGWDTVTPAKIHVARWRKQSWAAAQTPDLAVGDNGAHLVVRPSTPAAQPFYRFASVNLVDSSGKAIPATGARFDGNLDAAFDLSRATPGMATLRLQQEEASAQEDPVSVFIAPKRPNVGFICATRDNVIRAIGPDAKYVKAINVSGLQVVRTDDLPGGERSFTLSGPVPENASTVEAQYRDPGDGRLEWRHTEGLTIGAARPRFVARLIGSLPDSVPIGAGADPSWVTATLPNGAFRNRQPIRLRLSATPPFVWSHDVTLELGFGSANDVQTVASVPEGPSFAIDASQPDALLTLDLDATLPRNPRRNAGLLWFRVTRDGLSSPWTLAQSIAQDGPPLTALRLPTIANVESVSGRTRITLTSADDVVGVKFAGTTAVISPTLIESTANGLSAYVEGPADATEFELVQKNLTDSTVKVKVTKPKPPAPPKAASS